MRLLGRLRRTPESARPRPALAVVAGLLTIPVAAVAAQAGQSVLSQAQVGAASGGVIDRVLVRIDGRAVLYSEFELQWRDTYTALAAQFTQAELDAQAPLFRMAQMKAMAESIMLELRAEDLGIVANVNDVDRAIQQMREANNLLDDAAWQQTLAAAGLSEAILREQAEAAIIRQRMEAQEISRQVVVFPHELESFYEANQEQFVEPEQILFQQLIFVFTGADRTPVRERAENALTELRAGIPLSAVGNKYATPGVDSVQPADLATWVAPEDLQPAILAAVNNLTPLEYSEIVEGPFGYHILQLMDRKEGRVLPFEEVSNYIRNVLTQQKTEAAIERYAAELMKNASVEIYAEEFADLRSQWAEGAEGAPAGTPGRGR